MLDKINIYSMAATNFPQIFLVGWLAVITFTSRKQINQPCASPVSDTGARYEKAKTPLSSTMNLHLSITRAS